MMQAKPVAETAKRKTASKLRELPRLVLEDLSPAIEGGEFPVKRVVGDEVAVEATLFGDGHEQLAAELQWRAIDERKWERTSMEELANDRWAASFSLERLGRYEYVVEGWLDRFGGFRRDFRKKLDAGVAQDVDHAEGRQLVEEAAARSKGKIATALKKRLAALEKAEGEQSACLLLDDDLAALMHEADDRPHAIRSAPQPVDAERIAARFSSWYELFPRSMTDDKGRHGTFADVIDHLPRVRDMGFDTLYFPPIHPIGKTNRKGPNNTLTPEEGDPGSPYAIGSAEGGHDAIHPELGTFEDFDRLVKEAAKQGLEIALDFAIQAAPDHPWLKEHPGWFSWRPDGSMKYAENPPKKYQDIVNVDFYGPDAVPGLWEALRDVILLWVDHGVKTFRVDNPHTKPLPFWEWMIGEVRSQHPDVIFLSEAFTRPTMMYRLAKVGFSQSYTYFTWRNEKQELIDYITELTTEAPKDFYRPHFFVNTPDINPVFLQKGGRPAHRIRAALAATLSGLWGVYSGFELCDATPLGPDKEEYLDSEKYEIRPREWRSSNDIVDDITRFNELRRQYPALQTHLNTQFYLAHNDNIIWYGKPSADGSEMIMVMVSLDPHYPQECDFEVPLWEFGLGDDDSLAVEDLFGGYHFEWHGKYHHIALDPDEPFRVWRLTKPGEAA
ncbi:alpha-1,4-glucan--maltose-1-phosphate maltosyltransferase [Aurantiacibacter poecillastricola]|uniref:alpha-1,4-glucan--maltose-1-phosphate maltosyltransferase n=1 Tax=Aurantiacibacter poecillastricola TaxID=3064385 RepID=UPI00273FD320|nr:alpha-1,4-glucan--maltose-1-phosphate maltosyltransferase [Aurantiacibacter sp. 219JJ12-13]MDP5261321.1 alpha-1,4-glucan--maltose-1-phosphate maltosyltransferase [Aurantiacibacter sp. 219JJ12-13]